MHTVAKPALLLKKSHIGFEPVSADDRRKMAEVKRRERDAGRSAFILAPGVNGGASDTFFMYVTGPGSLAVACSMLGPHAPLASARLVGTHQRPMHIDHKTVVALRASRAETVHLHNLTIVVSDLLELCINAGVKRSVVLTECRVASGGDAPSVEDFVDTVALHNCRFESGCAETLIAAAACERGPRIFTLRSPRPMQLQQAFCCTGLDGLVTGNKRLLKLVALDAGLTDDACHLLLRALSSATPLCSLNLSFNGVGRVLERELSAALARCPSLMCISVRHTGLKVSALASLCMHQALQPSGAARLWHLHTDALESDDPDMRLVGDICQHLNESPDYTLSVDEFEALEQLAQRT